MSVWGFYFFSVSFFIPDGNNYISYVIKQKDMNEFLKGKRVRMIHMEDPNPIGKDELGTIEFEDSMGNIHVKWDNGRSLSIVPSEDKYEILSDEH